MIRKYRGTLLILILGLAVCMFSGCNSQDYNKATELMQNGDYVQALELFEHLEDYKDSADQALACRYAIASNYYEKNYYDEALQLFTSLGDYQDSSNMVKECQLCIASAMLDEEKYDEAVAILEPIKSFKNADTLLQKANKQIMLRDYADVFEALEQSAWFCNGGTINSSDCITFDNGWATVIHYFVDGNGIHKDSPASCSVSVNESAIVLKGSDYRIIPYKLSGKDLTLTNYLSDQQIDKAFQGCWHCLSLSYTLGHLLCEAEYAIQLNHGNVISENAAPVYGAYDGSYYYYGPYEGTYTLDCGVIKSSCFINEEWFFLVGDDGKPILTHYMTNCTPIAELPGENGYSF